MAGKWGKIWDSADRAASVISWLLWASTLTSVGLVYALVQEMPWYVAVSYGIWIAAGLVALIYYIDGIRLTHTIRGKIGVSEFTPMGLVLNPLTQKFEVQLAAHIRNSSLRPIFYKVTRISCHLDHVTHDPSPPAEPLEMPPGGGGGIPIPPIKNLNPSKQVFDGRVEVDFSYGKRADKLNRSYKTGAPFRMLVMPSPHGPLATIVVLGGKASHT